MRRNQGHNNSILIIRIIWRSVLGGVFLDTDEFMCGIVVICLVINDVNR